MTQIDSDKGPFAYLANEMQNNKLLGLASCAGLAAISFWINETQSHLGGTYWYLLWSFALVHLAASVLTISIKPRQKLIGVVVATLF